MSKLLQRIQAGGKAAIGMVQLAPLPGSSTYQDSVLSDIIRAAVDETKDLANAGFDAVMIQNLGDLPVTHKVTPSQIAWMSRVAFEVVQAVNIPIGLNFLENDAEAILSVASAAGLDFVRLKVFVGVMVSPSGLTPGCAYEANKTRNLLRAHDVAMFADVHDRTGIHLGGRDIDPDIREAIDLGHADGLVLTGGNFDESMDYIKRARAKFPKIPILLGGSASESNLAVTLAAADGVIISSALKDTNSAFGKINPTKAKNFMQAFRKLG
jgi:membrane complex biogenesis BtpA family protein